MILSPTLKFPIRLLKMGVLATRFTTRELWCPTLRVTLLYNSSMLISVISPLI